MAKRDPAKTALNKQIADLSAKLKPLEKYAVAALGKKDVLGLHAKIGSKNAEFIDVQHEVILSPEAYVSLWIRGLMKEVDRRRPCDASDPYAEIVRTMKTNKRFKEYVTLFLKRTYLRNHESLSKVRPHVQESEMWIGQKNADYGLLITPRFVGGEWENDKSEIRHFTPLYWSIGHILETGFVVPGSKNKIEFSTIKGYLSFFRNTLVRNSGSRHELAIADRYVDYVMNSASPKTAPLLIPELRYNGRAAKHEYRLDFTLIDPYSMKKVGFELSPWSTHGKLTNTKQKSPGRINAEAKANFEREMKKQKDYFRRHRIYALIYTDSDLADPDKLFGEIKKFLVPHQIARQLEVLAFDELDRFEL